MRIISALPATPRGVALVASAVDQAHILSLRLWFPWPDLEEALGALAGAGYNERVSDQDGELLSRLADELADLAGTRGDLRRDALEAARRLRNVARRVEWGDGHSDLTARFARAAAARVANNPELYGRPGELTVARVATGSVQVDVGRPGWLSLSWLLRHREERRREQLANSAQEFEMHRARLAAVAAGEFGQGQLAAELGRTSAAAMIELNRAGLSRRARRALATLPMDEYASLEATITTVEVLQPEQLAEGTRPPSTSDGGWGVPM